MRAAPSPALPMSLSAMSAAQPPFTLRAAHSPAAFRQSSGHQLGALAAAAMLKLSGGGCGAVRAWARGQGLCRSKRLRHSARAGCQAWPLCLQPPSSSAGWGGRLGEVTPVRCSLAPPGRALSGGEGRCGAGKLEPPGILQAARSPAAYKQGRWHQLGAVAAAAALERAAAAARGCRHGRGGRGTETVPEQAAAPQHSGWVPSSMGPACAATQQW